DAEPRSFRYGAEAPLVARMIQIAQGLGAGRSKPFRVIGHQVAGIAMRDEGVAHGVPEPLIEAAMSQPVVTGILPEDRGIEKGVEKIPGNIVQERYSIALSESGNALSKSG